MKIVDNRNKNYKLFAPFSLGASIVLKPLTLGWGGKRSTHRDKTRVQMPAKIFPHLKVKC
jgi:hypothetical protein